MIRFLLAIPLAITLVIGLFSSMAWMVSSGKQRVASDNTSLSFNMFMIEQETEVARRQRSVPPPPEAPQPPEPETPKMSTTRMQVSAASVDTPKVEMNFSVSGLAISVPAVASVPSQTVSNADKQLMPLSRVEAVYPAKAKKRRIEGYVVLKFDIDEQGRTKNIEVVEAQPERFFERSAIDAIKRWRYQPQIIDGQAQSILGYTTKIEFKMAP